MVEFYAKYKTKTKRPINFKTSSGKKVKFKAKRVSKRRKKVKFQVNQNNTSKLKYRRARIISLYSNLENITTLPIYFKISIKIY